MSFHVKFKEKSSMQWFKSKDFDNKEDMLAHYWEVIRPVASEVKFETPKGKDGKPVETKKVTKEGYDKVPNSLMGFKQFGQNKGFDDQKYPHTQHVEVSFHDGDKFHDAVKGMNKEHALERAKRNWEGAKIKAIDTPNENLKTTEETKMSAKDIVENAILGDAISLKDLVEELLEDKKQTVVESLSPEVMAELFGITYVPESSEEDRVKGFEKKKNKDKDKNKEAKKDKAYEEKEDLEEAPHGSENPDFVEKDKASGKKKRANLVKDKAKAANKDNNHDYE